MRPPAPQASGPDTSGGGCRRPVQCRTPRGDGYHGGHGGAPRRARAGGALGCRVRRLGAPGALHRRAPLHLRGECACSAHRPARVSLSLALDRLLRRVDCFLPRTRRISQLCRQFADYYIWELDFRAASLKLYFCGFLFLLVLNSSALLCACMV